MGEPAPARPWLSAASNGGRCDATCRRYPHASNKRDRIARARTRAVAIRARADAIAAHARACC